jgi:hypothetical protein
LGGASQGWQVDTLRARRIDRRTPQRILLKRPVRSDTAYRIAIALGRRPDDL